MKCYIFDFDDTLSKTSWSKVLLFGNRGAIRRSKPLPLISLARKAAKEGLIYIVTARAEDKHVRKEILNWLYGQGVCVSSQNLFMVDGIGKYKSQVINWIVKEEPGCYFYFYDDFPGNLEAVARDCPRVSVYSVDKEGKPHLYRRKK